MTEFDGSPGSKSEEEFILWKDTNPNGFILNYKGNGVPVLHRTNCGHFKGFTSPVDLTKNTKICSLDRDGLIRAGSDKFGDIRSCGSCRP